MLRLERLVMQGFKSFKKRVSVPLPGGFSVITGPNGSGKTNILDAICFVLGRTSSRTMRAKKSQNLIFHGSRNRPGSDHAIVILHFDNSDKTLPMDENVTISRRINQKGVSTYRLNGKIVTRQQILDAFTQAGIHPDGYNIIQQGDVNQIVEMDPVERRGIIDEIAGISEYDDKKVKAMKEMAKIDEKLGKADIILQEKQKIMEKLRQERDVAVQYKKLESDMEKIRASLVYLDRSGAEKRLKEINEKLKAKNELAEKLDREIKDYDSKISELEKNLSSLTKNLLKAQDQIELSKTIVRLESDIEIKKGQMESNKREMERLSEMATTMGSPFSFNTEFKRMLEFSGVFGPVSELMKVSPKYRVAVEVSAGSHLRDIIVDTSATAVRCIKHLKKTQAGRARFLPLDKIRVSSRTKFLPKQAIDWLSNLVSYENKFSAAMEYIFGTTACVTDIDTAKAISKTQRVRMVTLDGDLVEASGAMTGGFYKRRAKSNQNNYLSQVRGLEQENAALAKEIADLEKKLRTLSAKETKTDTMGVEKSQARFDTNLKKLQEKRRDAYEKKLSTQQDLGKLSIQRAKLEARLDDLKERVDEKDIEKMNKEDLKPFIDLSITTLKTRLSSTIESLQNLGPVNLKALQDFDSLAGEFEKFREKVSKIIEEKDEIKKTIDQIESRRRETFMKTMEGISRNFKEIYMELTGGEAGLELGEKENIESGLIIRASPAGKKLLHIDSMSGGEKTLTAFAFLFGIQRLKPTPFYVLDEADAALDKTNTKRIVELLKKYSKIAQFVVISHNDSLVKEADQIYGVSMEAGESKIFGVKLPENN